MTPPPRLPRVVAIHPVSRGFGWVVFEGPLAPLDWGFSVTRGEKNVMCIEKVDNLIAKHLPETLVLEAFEPRYSSRSERMTRLGRALTTLATSRGIDVAVFTRIDVKACFATNGARTRHEIAQAIAKNFDVFQAFLPEKRKGWQSEKDVTAVFSAAAVALTRYYLGAATLFDDLSSARSPGNPTESS